MKKGHTHTYPTLDTQSHKSHITKDLMWDDPPEPGEK